MPEIVTNDQEASAPPPAQAPPHPATAAGVASNLEDVLRTDQIFHQAPAMALALAKLGGNVQSNAQAVGAIAHVRALDIAAQNLSFAEQNQVAPKSSGGGFFGDIVGGVESAARTVGGGIASGAKALASSAEATGQDIAKVPGAIEKQFGQSELLKPGGIADKIDAAKASGTGIGGLATIGVQGAMQGFVRQAGQQLNPIALLNTPSHLLRTWVDIEHRHGPAAMVEAMIPSVLGAGAGYLLTHSPKGIEEGADIGAGGVAAEGEAAAPVEATNAAQRVGQAARTVTRAVGRPVATVVGAPIRAATAVGTSPSFLGANVAGISTQLDKSFRDSWVRTTNAAPKGEIGSFGRLVATGVEDIGRKLGLPGMQKGSMFFNSLSGGLDAFGDIAILDPIGAGGRVVGQARSAEGLPGVLGHFFGGTQITSPDDVDRILQQYPAARAFVKDAAQLDSGQLLYKYGMAHLNGPMAARLGAAGTEADVVAALKDSARSMELATTTGKMPMLTNYLKAKSVLGETRLGAALTVPLPTMFEDDLARFTGREFTAGDPNAVESIMHLMRAMGERPQVVTDTGSMLLETADPRRWANVLANVSKVAIGRQVLKAIGDNPLSDQMLRSINQASEEMFGGRGAGFEGKFASDPAGRDLSVVMTNPGEEEQQSRAAAIYDKQLGKMVMPTVRDVQKVSKEIAEVVKWNSAKGVYAKGQNLRDWLDVVVNHKFFQPLALATGGWALRVSSSEALLNTLRLGPLNYSAARIAASAAKHDLAIGVIQTDPRVLADMDKADRLAARAIQSSTASNAATRATVNLTRNVVATVRGVLAGTEESLLKGIGKERYLDAATKLVLLHDGYLLPGGISAVHNLPLVGQDEVAKKEADIRSWQQRFGQERKIKNVTVGGEYTFLSPAESGYWSELSAHQGLISASEKVGRPAAIIYRDALERGLTDEQATAEAVSKQRQLIAAMDPAERSYFLRDTAASPDSTQDPLTDWAMNAVGGIKGAVSSQFGPLHREMLNGIADGTVPPTAKAMMEKYANRGSEHFIDPVHLPRGIPGRTVNLDPSMFLQRAASYMHTRVFGKIVNYLSREPTFIADFANESKLLEAQVREGTITQDQADVVAQTRAIFKSIRFVHNPQDRMKIEQTLHVIAPFYFAKNQAIRRAGRLLATNPGAFEQYLKLNLAVQNTSFKLNQKNGQASFTFPGSTVVGAAMTSLMTKLGLFPQGSVPVSLSGSADAMQAIVPWSGNGEQVPGSPQSLFSAIANPDLGPLGSIPVKGVANFTTGFTATAANDILGPIGSNTAWWTYLVPNSILQHFSEDVAFEGGSQSLGTSANSSLLSMIASVADSSRSTAVLTQIVPSDVTGKNVDPATAEINVVQQRQLIKQIQNGTAIMLLGRLLASGMSPVSLSLQRADLKLSNEVQTYINKAGGNITTGIDNFVRDNPNAVASTVYQSTSDVGSGWGDTAKDGQWMKDNKAIIDKYPNAAQWLVPPTDNVGPFSETTHLMQLAEGLRHEDTPQEFLTGIYVAAGNAWYYNDVRPQLEAALKANPSQSYNIYNQYDTYIANYGKRNPSWLDYWNAQQSTSARTQSLGQLTQMLADPVVPKTQQTDRLQALVNGYNQYLGEKTSATSSAQRATLKAGWQAEMVATAKAWPNVAPAINDLFSHLS